MATVVRRRKLGMSSAKGIAVSSKQGIKWCRNDLGIPHDDMYIRWGCTANLPNANATVINSAKAIHCVSNKLEFRRLLNDNNLCPATWFGVEDVPENSLAKGVIVRPHVHSRGRHIWKCHDWAHLRDVVAILPQGFYISEFVDKVQEFRVFVVQGRAVAVAEKTPDNPKALAWNVAKGGRFDNVSWNNWNVKAVRIAIEGFNLSGLDFGGVDVMVDAKGSCTILEINSAPSLTSPYRQECMAKALDYIVENGKGDIPLINERGGYLKFIHPALTNKAKIGE